MSARADGGDFVTLAEFAELAGMGKSGLVMARNRGGDFPAAIEDERGRLLYDRQEAEAWVEARAARRTAPTATRPRKEVGGGARNVVKASYLTMLESERRRGVVHPAEFSIEGMLARVRATVREERALAGWLDDVLCGPLTDRDIVGLRELDATVRQTPPHTWNALLEDVVAGTANVDTGGRVILDEVGTPTSVVELMGSLAGPATRGVLDPAAGVGSLLLDAPGVSPSVPLYAYEINFESATIARCRAYFRGRDLRIVGTDALNAPSPWMPTQDVDRVLCHAPFGMDREKHGIDLDFALRVAEQVVGGGTAVLLVSIASLRSPRTRELRRRLLTSGMLRSVIAIPPPSGSRSRVDAALLVLTAQCAQPEGDILFADTRPVSQSGRRSRTASAVEQADVVRRVRVWLSGESDLQSGTYGVANARAIRSSTQSLLLPADYILPERVSVTASELRSSVNAIKKSLEGAQGYLTGTIPAVNDDTFRLESVAHLRKRGLVQLLSGFRVRDIALSPIPDDGTPSSFTPVITQQSLRHSGTLNAVEMLPTEHVLAAHRTRPGDVIFSTFGSPLAIVDTEGDHVITTPLQILRCETPSVNPDLAAETLRSDVTARRITTSTVERLDIGALLLPVTTDEGEAAAFVKAFTRLIDLRRELTDTTQQLDTLIDLLTRSTHTPPDTSPTSQETH